MLYVTYNDLVNDIRGNIYKIQENAKKGAFCGVIGVPRSGMIPAGIISEYLNIGLCSLNEFLEHQSSAFSGHGERLLNSPNTEKMRILVVDDTCFSGHSLMKTKDKLKVFNDKYEFVFMAVYLEGKCGYYFPDLYLRDVRDGVGFVNDIVLYEWNILHHHYQDNVLYDLDGVIVLDPPDERNTESYIKYISDPTPLFIPSTERELSICTYRLSIYYNITLNSLKKIGLKSPKIYMYNAQKYEDRKTPPYEYKSAVYTYDESKKLFVESEDFQAKKIYEITKKPVYCVGSNKMYS